jgi:hypothetical protein
MSLLTKLRTRVSTGAEVIASEAGHALVLHAPAGMTAEAQSLATSVAAEPDHDLVVADLPEGSPSSAWTAFAAKLPSGHRAIRLVVTGPFRQSGAAIGEWLSGQLGRTVVASQGLVLPTANGGLFVQAGRDGGWTRFRPGHAPAQEGSRHPRPGWESSAVAEVVPIGPAGGAEPLPAGVWLRADGDPRWLAVSRARLTRTLPCHPDVLTLVLNGQHMPELDLEGVGRFWSRLPVDVRAKARFVDYGPVRLPGGATLGRSLADLLGEEVRLYAGMPAGPGQVFTIRPDGSHGWNTFAPVLGYRPGHSGAPDRLGHRDPIPGLAEIAPGVYRYAPDVVLEVVPAGLWVRPAETVEDPEGIRSTPLDVTKAQLFHSADDPEILRLAGDVLERLDYPTRLVTELKPVRGTAGPQQTPATDALGSEPEATTRLSSPPLPSLARLIGTEAFVVPAEVTTEAAEPVDGVTESMPAVAAEDPAPDRGGPRDTWQEQFDAELAPVREILAGHSAFAGASKDEDALTDLVALRLYLAGRAAETAEHVRRVTAGLDRMPAHRGVTTTTLTPTASQWQFCRENPVLTEQGFLNVLTEPAAGREGDTDLLVWSVTGRSTALLEPAGSRRVVFLPGTRFKVLDTAEPAAGARGRIFLRELLAQEIDAEGRPAANRVSVDKLADAKLRRAAGKLVDGDSGEPVPTAVAARLGRLPGVAGLR